MGYDLANVYALAGAAAKQLPQERQGMPSSLDALAYVAGKAQAQQKANTGAGMMALATAWMAAMKPGAQTRGTPGPVHVNPNVSSVGITTSNAATPAPRKRNGGQSGDGSMLTGNAALSGSSLLGL